MHDKGVDVATPARPSHPAAYSATPLRFITPTPAKTYHTPRRLHLQGSAQRVHTDARPSQRPAVQAAEPQPTVKDSDTQTTPPVEACWQPLVLCNHHRCLYRTHWRSTCKPSACSPRRSSSLQPRRSCAACTQQRPAPKFSALRKKQKLLLISRYNQATRQTSTIHAACMHSTRRSPRLLCDAWKPCGGGSSFFPQGLAQVVQLSQGSPMKLSPTEQSIRMRLRSATKSAPKRGVFCPVCPHSP